MNTRIDQIITSRGDLATFMESKGLIEYYDPTYLYDLSLKYEIDPGFALAVFILETGWGKESQAWLNGYNPAGITCGGSYCLYASPEEGIEEMYKLLKAYTDGSISYVRKCTTVSEVRAKWSQANDTDKLLSIWRAIYD